MKYRLLGVLVISGLLTGCASSEPSSDTGRSDPLEGFNRTMFDFNYNVLDPYILRPVAVTWNDYMPTPARAGLSNFSSNLAEPASVVNYLLQGEFRQSLKHFHRFVINTAFGLGGLIDVANYDEGLRRGDSRRFGSVLGHYDVGYGPYVVLPGYGSFTLREDVGDVADTLYPPLVWLLGWPAVGKWVLDGIETRARFLDHDQILHRSADPYIFMREAYFQHKDFLVNGGKSMVTINPNAVEIEDELGDIDRM